VQPVCTKCHGLRKKERGEGKGTNKGRRASPEECKKLSERGKARKGKSACKGEVNGNSKLTEENVRYIRGLHEIGFNQHELAKMYDVTSQAIWRIVHRKCWAHVTGEISLIPSESKS
jgi:hypothetical protein